MTYKDKLFEENTDICTSYNDNLVRRLMNNELKDEGINVLKMSIRFNRPDIVRALIYNCGVDVKESYNDANNCSVLHQSIITGNISIINMIIDAGIDVNNNKYHNNNTALHLSVEKDDVYISKILLDAGANQNILDKNQNSAIQIAILRNNEEMVDMLLQYSIDIELVDKQGRTPLHNAVLLRRNKIVEKLINAGASINSKCNKGYSIIESSTKTMNYDVLKILLVRGADSETVNSNKDTPLTSYCSIKGNTLCDISKLLIAFTVLRSTLCKVKSNGIIKNIEFINSIPCFYNYNLICEYEITKMCKISVGYNVNMLDYVRFGYYNDYNSLSRCVKSLIKVIKCSKFTIYGDLIKRYIKIGFIRRTKLVLSTDYLMKEISVLPYEIVYQIAEKYTNKELDVIR